MKVEVEVTQKLVEAAEGLGITTEEMAQRMMDATIKIEKTGRVWLRPGDKMLDIAEAMTIALIICIKGMLYAREASELKGVLLGCNDAEVSAVKHVMNLIAVGEQMKKGLEGQLAEEIEKRLAMEHERDQALAGV